MPRVKSAKKRLRQSRARAAQNRTQRSQLRSAIKKVRQATDDATRQQAYSVAERLIDRAGQKKLIHPNAASRLKSRLRSPRQGA